MRAVNLITVALLIAALAVLTGAILAMPGCVGWGGSHDYATRVDGASVVQVDKLDKRGKGEDHEKVMRLTVTPSTQPAAAGQEPSTQPVRVSIDGKQVEAPAGSAVSLEVTEKGSQKPEETIRDRSAQAQGASLRSDKEGAGAVKSDAPTVDLKPIREDGAAGGGGSSDGGDSSFSWTGAVAAISAASAGARWLMGIGVAVMVIGFIVFGAILWLEKKPELLLLGIFEVTGVALIATGIVIDTHPLLFILTVLLVISLVVFYFYHKNIAAKASATGQAGPGSSSFSPASLLQEAEDAFAKLRAKYMPPPPSPPAS